MPTEDLIAGLNLRDDDEGLFSRNLEGQLVRLDLPTAKDYDQDVKLMIDGQEVTVKLAVPQTDANGNTIVDANGVTTPRYTTILDAAHELYVKKLGDQAKLPIPVLCHQPHMTPVAVCRLCVVQIYGMKRGKRAAERKLLPACQHPVKPGMEVFTMHDKGKDGAKVRQTVSVVTQLLAADHLKPEPTSRTADRISPFNELGQVAARVEGDALLVGAVGARAMADEAREKAEAALLEAEAARNAGEAPPVAVEGEKPKPTAEQLATAAARAEKAAVRAEQAAVRAAAEATPLLTETIAAESKKTNRDVETLLDERKAGLAEMKAARFQLDVFTKPLNPPPEPKPRAGRRKLDTSSPVFMVDHSACILCDRCVRACDEVQENHVIGRTGKGANAGIGFDLNDPMGASTCVKCGECMVSCPTSAITFKAAGKIKIKSKSTDRHAEPVPVSQLLKDPVFAGMPPKFLLWQEGLVIRRHIKSGEVLCRQGDAGNTAFLIKSGRIGVTVYEEAKADGGIFGKLLSGGAGKVAFTSEVTPSDLVVGEMACLTGTPRTATLTALEDSEVWELRRNVLDRLMRLPTQHDAFEDRYQTRSLPLALRATELFKTMPKEEFDPILKALRGGLKFMRVKPGQTVFRQGEAVNDVYLVRLGHVRIAVSRYGAETRVVSAGPGAIIGEIGMLAFDPTDRDRPVDKVDLEVKAALDAAGDDFSNYPKGKRTGTVSALGHLEMARISREDFLRVVRDFSGLRRRLVEQSLARLRNDTKGHRFLDDYVGQGLYEGRSILTLDTDLCTRCDECTKACVQQHGSESHGMPITRMLRDGLRFDNYLIAAACRSCVDPHCMFGCPVDSIHRGKHLQIVIEDHCIGCGLCEENCPYGNIFMSPNKNDRVEVFTEDEPSLKRYESRPKAATCDLCDAEGERDTPRPRCVAACPHDAAHRMSGEELMQKVLARNQKIAKPWQS